MSDFSDRYPAHPHVRPTEALVAAGQAGDREALEALFHRYIDRARVLAHHKLGKRLRTRLDSQDIGQEVLLRVVQALPRYRPNGESSFVRWLTAITLNVIRNRVRSMQTLRRGGAEALEQAQGEVAEDQRGRRQRGPATEAGQLDQKELIHAALQELDETSRILIVLRDLEGVGWADIAAKVHAPNPRAACMRHTRARAKLGELLRRKGLSTASLHSR